MTAKNSHWVPYNQYETPTGQTEFAFVERTYRAGKAGKEVIFIEADSIEEAREQLPTFAETSENPEVETDYHTSFALTRLELIIEDLTKALGWLQNDPNHVPNLRRAKSSALWGESTMREIKRNLDTAIELLEAK